MEWSTWTGLRIQDMIDFGEKIKATKVIFSCIEHKEDLENEIKKIMRKGDLQIEVIDKSEIITQFPGLSFSKQSKRDGKMEEPLHKIKAYESNLEIVDDPRHG